MENKENTYRNIVKTTSLFGGVQVIQILTSVVRGKLVAVLLGVAGMGVNTIFVSLINMISQAASLGLNFSAVRDISQATESGETSRIAHIIKTFNRWMIFCALLGSVFTLALADVINRFSFEDGDYANWIRVVSIAVFLTIIGKSQTTILQGSRRHRELAKSSLIGAFLSLLASIPLYYFLGLQGIVPALIIAAGTTYCVGWFYVRKLHTPSVNQSVAESFHQGKEMTKLGLIMMVSSFMGMLGIYLINAYVSKYGSLSDVGFYGAGTSITNQYVGLVFTAMAVDYFPRLSAVANNRVKVREIVNQQGEIVTLIATPLIVGMMLTAPILIRILLSEEFLVIREFICILAFGMFFKATSYAVGYISFSKGDKKLFFLLEGVYGNSMTLLLNILGYYFGGLTGMAISYTVSFILYLIIVLIITKIRYNFTLTGKYVKMLVITFIFTSSIFIQTLYFNNVWGYIIGGLIFLLTLIYSYKELDKRMNIKELLKRKL